MLGTEWTLGWRSRNAGEGKVLGVPVLSPHPSPFAGYSAFSSQLSFAGDHF